MAALKYHNAGFAIFFCPTYRRCTALLVGGQQSCNALFNIVSLIGFVKNREVGYSPGYGMFCIGDLYIEIQIMNI